MRATTMAAMLALAACSGGKDAGGNTAGAAAEGGQGSGETANLTADPQNGVVPVAPASPTAIKAIPASFQGRWGMVAADCDPAKADIAKGLMAIEGDRLSFYESRGTATGLRQFAPGSIGFDLPMSGEGMSWSEPTRLTLQGDGRTLIRQATGSPDRAGSFTYQRCPA